MDGIFVMGSGGSAAITGVRAADICVCLAGPALRVSARLGRCPMTATIPSAAIVLVETLARPVTFPGRTTRRSVNQKSPSALAPAIAAR